MQNIRKRLISSFGREDPMRIPRARFQSQASNASIRSCRMLENACFAVSEAKRTPQGQVTEPSLKCFDSLMQNARKRLFWSFRREDCMRTPQGQVFRAKPQMLRFANAECSKTCVLELWRGGPHEGTPGPGSRAKLQNASIRSCRMLENGCFGGLEGRNP